LNDREGGPGVFRKPRADAERNRIRLMEVAKTIVAGSGSSVGFLLSFGFGCTVLEAEAVIAGLDDVAMMGYP
jgi:hypothetical protein